MAKYSGPRTPPSWTKPGNRWTPRLAWPMLGVSVALLVWRVVDGDRVSRILVASALVLVWVYVLAANRSARRKRGLPQAERSR